ncbi:MAG TPA: sensor histidine kinase [Opitutaceae bacterium]|nr:sensor histidine kinase [Opitutaceae bacterium]
MPATRPSLFLRPRPRQFRVRVFASLSILSVALCGSSISSASDSPSASKGLPLTRFYPFDDIGDVSRGSELLFDSAGRLAVVHDGIYVALNDEDWLQIGIVSADGARVQHVEPDRDGKYYYGARGSWGTLERTLEGQIQTHPLTEKDRPAWTTDCNFNDVLSLPTGICFIGDLGVVVWSKTTGQTRYINVPATVTAFELEDKLYVSSHSQGTVLVDIEHGTFGPADRNIFENFVIDRVAQIDGERTIASTTGRRLLVYNNGKLEDLQTALGEPMPGRATAMQKLPNGEVAIAVTGQGLYIITSDGGLVTALTQPEYRSISSLATNADGVLWACTESGVVKILSGGPITTFGQALGISIGWPQVVSWDDKTIIASNGRVYEPIPRMAGEPAHFRLMPNQPAIGAWGIAVCKEWLLLSNGDGVFATRRGEPFRRIARGADRLAMLGPDTCIAISGREIMALREDGGTWRECAAPIPGIGPAMIVQSSEHAVWIESGVNRAGRIALVDGKLSTRVYDKFSWQPSRWVHLSVVGNLAILNGPESGRMFVDERTGDSIDIPAFASVLAGLPVWAARVHEDQRGRLWVSHAHGVIALTPAAEGYKADTNTYRLITDHRPFIQSAGNGVWVSSGRSLYHIDPSRVNTLSYPRAPRLVSVKDSKTNRELLLSGASEFLLTLPYAQNSLLFRFFAGSYASRTTPNYQVRLNDERWSSLDKSALLRLSDLREGDYRLDARFTDESGPVGDTTTLRFSIQPPWHRTWLARSSYVLLGALAIFALIRLLLYRARVRNAALEKIVENRTEELRVAMARLEQETRASATLAERNRLAGELHDSLEQGFSGLALHLETITAFDDCPPLIRRALTVARNMVTFSRNEVRSAVWDLHSPMLEESDFMGALNRVVAQSLPDPSRVCVCVQGDAHPLGSAAEHHLLRIAQEAVANAVKHARFDRLNVEVVYTEREVTLTIRDDGRGFDAKTVMTNAENGHFGLRSLRGRAARIGAKLTVESSPGSGTCITVRATKTI